MGFETLELFKRRQIRILIIQTDHKADGDFVVVEMVNKRAAVGLTVERPARAVYHQTGLMFFRRHFPNLFDAQAVSLRLAVLVELETFDDLFGKRTAATFGKQGLLRPKLHAGLETVGRLAVFADTHIAGRNAFDRTIFVIQHFGSGKARIDFHAHIFRLLRQPAHDFAQADDVVAMIVEIGSNRQIERLFLRQEQHFVLRYRTRQRRAFFFPVGNQLIQRNRINDRPRQRMRARLRTLLHHANADFAPVFFGKLLEFDGGGQTRRACADNHDIVLHTVAGDGFCHGGSCMFIIELQTRDYTTGTYSYQIQQRSSENHIFGFQTTFSSLLLFGFKPGEPHQYNYKTEIGDAPVRQCNAQQIVRHGTIAKATHNRFKPVKQRPVF